MNIQPDALPEAIPLGEGEQPVIAPPEAMPIKDSAQAPPSLSHKKCPFCAECIRSEAVFCRYCQRKIPESAAVRVVGDARPTAKDPITLALQPAKAGKTTLGQLLKAVGAFVIILTLFGMLLPVILGEKANNTFTFVPGKITPTVPPSFTTTPRSYQRDEFQKLVVGKTKSQLIDLLGKPTSTSEAGPWEYWQYTQPLDQVQVRRVRR